jgi:hypothetical protein
MAGQLAPPMQIPLVQVYPVGQAPQSTEPPGQPLPIFPQ